MPSHVIYKAVDSLPAGFSPKWIKQVLRSQLNYQGAVISDDLGMAGAYVAGDIVARAKAALSAGCDAILACNDFDDIDTLVYADLGSVTEQSAKRLEGLLPHSSGRDWNELTHNVEYQQALNEINSL